MTASTRDHTQSADPVEDLVNFWRGWPRSGAKPPFIHPEDRFFFDQNVKLRAVEKPSLCKACAPGFHLMLRPVPYMGNLVGDTPADIFLLMYNPVVRLQDYCDNENGAFLAALEDNLTGRRQTCLAFDTDGVGETSWTCYYRNEVFKTSVRSDLWGKLQRRLAILELVPYYSPDFNFGKRPTEKLLTELPSVKIMRHAGQHLAERARGGKAHLIVRWKKGCERWDIRADSDNIVHTPVRQSLSRDAQTRLRNWLTG